jgi:CheY-like chemotaxis protein
MKTVLIVDDEFCIREALSEILEADGYAVVTAQDGTEGLARLDDARPDVVLLDFMMPAMDGLEMLRRMRDLPEHRGTPVVLMTAAPKGIDAGDGQWDVLLPKPFDVDHLERLIQRLLAR